MPAASVAVCRLFVVHIGIRNVTLYARRSSDIDFDPKSEVLVKATADEIREHAAGVEDEWLRNSVLEAAENLDGQNEYHYKKIPKPEDAELLRRLAAANARAIPAKGKCKGFRQGKAAARGKGGHEEGSRWR